MKLLGLIFTFFQLANAGEGGQEAHGGRVWTCRSEDGAITYELLDYRKAQDVWGLSISLGELDPGATELDYVRSVLERLEKIDFYRAKRYLKSAETILDANRMGNLLNYVMPASLPEKPLEELRPRECTETIVIIQRNPLRENDYFDSQGVQFLRDQETYNLLDVKTRAGLILHEIVLEDAINAQTIEAPLNVNNVMRMNAWIASTQLATLTPQEWKDKYRYFGFFQAFSTPEGEFNLSKIENSTVELDSQAIIPKKAQLAPGSYVLVNGQKIQLCNKWIGPSLPNANTAYFSDDGHLELAAFCSGNKIEVGGVSFIPLQGYITFVQGHLMAMNVLLHESFAVPQLLSGGIDKNTAKSFNFYPSGEISGASLKKPVKLKLADRLVDVNFVQFGPDHQAIGATLASSYRLKTTSGKMKRFRAGEHILFNDRGEVLPSGVFAPGSTHFIQVEKIEDQVGFRYCESNDLSKPCEQISQRAFYDSAQVMKFVRTSLVTRNFIYTHGAAVALGFGVGVPLVALGIGLGPVSPLAALLLFGSGATFGGLSGVIYDNEVVRKESNQGLPVRMSTRKLVRGDYLMTTTSIEKLREEIEEDLIRIQ